MPSWKGQGFLGMGGSGGGLTAHASSHQHGGSDQIATATPGANAIPKANGSGKLDAWISNSSTSTAGLVQLATSGEAASNKAVAGTDGRLSDARTPTAHASSHQHGGSDPIATATPGSNAIPKANGSGKLDAWISNSSTSVAGLVQLATDAENSSSKAVAANDRRLGVDGHVGHPVNTGGTANVWYAAGLANHNTATYTSTSFTLDGWRVVPVTQTGARTIDGVYINVNALSAGGLVLVALYKDNGAGYPGALVGSTEFDVGSTGQKTTTGLTWAMEQGSTYWVAVNMKATVSLKAFSVLLMQAGAWSSGATTGSCGWFLSETYSSTAPSTFTAGGSLAQPASGTVPAVWLRYSA